VCKNESKKIMKKIKKPLFAKFGMILALFVM
jgi:hypothetical protein